MAQNNRWFHCISVHPTASPPPENLPTAISDRMERSRPAVLHEMAPLLYFRRAFLRPDFFTVELQRNVPVLLHVQQLLKEFLHVVIRFRRRFHEGASPGLSFGFPCRHVHLAVFRFVAFVSCEHDERRKEKWNETWNLWEGGGGGQEENEKSRIWKTGKQSMKKREFSPINKYINKYKLNKVGYEPVADLGT